MFFLRYMSSTNGTLRLLSVQEGDEGSYQCVVANTEDTAQGTAYLWLGGMDSTLAVTHNTGSYRIF